MSVRDIIENDIGKEDAPKFAKWAFGTDFFCVDICGMFFSWNERHGDKLLLDPKSKPEDDMPKMIELWRKHETF